MPGCTVGVCRVAKGNRLTPKLLAAADNGCECSLRRVTDIVQKGSDPCTRKVIKLAFKFLDPEPLTRFTAENPWYSLSNRLASNRAMHCLSLLHSIASEFYSDPFLVSDELDSYVQSIDGICQWITHALQRADVNVERSGQAEEGAGLTHWAGILAMTHGVHPRIARALWSSTAFCKLLIQMWAFKTSTGRFKIFFFLNAGCLILKLMRECLNDEEGRELLLRELTRLPHFANTFTTVTIRRCRQVQEDHLKGETPRSEALHYVSSAMDVILFSASHNQLVERAFAKRQYLKHLVSSMVSLADGASRTDGTFVFLEESSRRLVSLAIDIPSNRVDYNFGELVDGGFVEYIGRLLDLFPENMDYDPELVDRVERVIQILGSQMIHPHVTSRLQEVATKVEGLARRCRDPVLKDACDALYEKFQNMNRIHNSFVKGHVYLCDNQKCGRQLRPNSSESTVPASKKCSGCSTVIYCSVQCQEDDWAEMHQSECSRLRVEYFCRKARRHRYPPSVRAYHVAYFEYLFNLELEEFERRLADDPDPQEGIPWYDLGPFLGPGVPSPTSTIDQSTRKKERGSPNPIPITERLESTRDLCLRPGAELRIVHASLFLGYFGVFLMVQLEKVGERYEAIHSYFYTV
ncbi:hypothetical protein D9611_014444 [Ephemerocybe angulata]|uniref:phytol kinase n=1 Tax=Ephemerocybe angulata TaxID=980116 RepID=A0A8H5ERH5_9AGAR|nr:hypothetical protein D9611_014444 [Tulosesus angulatus]